jgi:hypothetical protein
MPHYLPPFARLTIGLQDILIANPVPPATATSGLACRGFP